MPEENNAVKTGETTAETVEKEKTEQKTEPNYFEIEAKKAFQERDEAKRKARELEAKLKEIEEKSLQEQGKYKELYEQKAVEYSKKVEELSSNLQYKEKYIILEKSIRESLIEQIPEDKRKFAEKFDLDELKEFVTVETKSTGGKIGTADASYRTGKGRIDYSKAALSELTDEQKDDLAKNYPGLFQQKLNEFLKTNKRY